MIISIPLDEASERQVRKILKGREVTDFVREAITEKHAREEQKNLSVYEAGKELFDRYGCGCDDLSSNRKSIVRDKIRAKHCGLVRADC